MKVLGADHNSGNKYWQLSNGVWQQLFAGAVNSVTVGGEDADSDGNADGTIYIGTTSDVKSSNDFQNFTTFVSSTPVTQLIATGIGNNGSQRLYGIAGSSVYAYTNGSDWGAVPHTSSWTGPTKVTYNEDDHLLFVVDSNAVHVFDGTNNATPFGGTFASGVYSAAYSNQGNSLFVSKGAQIYTSDNAGSGETTIVTGLSPNAEKLFESPNQSKPYFSYVSTTFGLHFGDSTPPNVSTTFDSVQINDVAHNYEDLFVATAGNSLYHCPYNSTYQCDSTPAQVTSPLQTTINDVHVDEMGVLYVADSIGLFASMPPLSGGTTTSQYKVTNSELQTGDPVNSYNPYCVNMFTDMSGSCSFAIADIKELSGATAGSNPSCGDTYPLPILWELEFGTCSNATAEYAAFSVDFVLRDGNDGGDTITCNDSGLNSDESCLTLGVQNILNNP
jgi:hypothetical protein